MGPKRY